MGCPDIYYTRALQSLAYCLAYNNDDRKLAKELFNETSEKRLEDFIMKQKEQIEEKDFYYNAGRTSQHVLDEAEQENIDSLNASFCGLFRFECFLGIVKEDKD